METRTRKFELLFSVSLDYDSILLEPDEESRLLLAKSNQLWKISGNNLQVIAEQPWAVEKRKYRFLIRVTDTSFFKLTRLDLTDFPAQLFCFTHAGENKDLKPVRYANPGYRTMTVLGMIEISIGKRRKDPFQLTLI